MNDRRFLARALAAAIPLIFIATCKEPDEAAKVTGQAQSGPALAGLAASDGTLEPAFSRDVAEYALLVKNSVESITVTPTAREASASVSVNGALCGSGKPSAPIALAVGENAIRVSARGTDGAERTYEIAVTRARDVPLLTLDFEYGVDGPSSHGNIYVAWVEDLSGKVVQNLVVCDRLVGIGGKLTNTALPFWKTKRYDAGQVAADAVTGATKARQNFSVSATLKDPTVTAFKVCFETDRSYDANDWFTDQPALLYSVTVDLSRPERSYPLELEAWTANEGTMSSLRDFLGTLSVGNKQTETRFITNSKDGTSSAKPPFGDADPDASATCFVKGISLRVE